MRTTPGPRPPSGDAATVDPRDFQRVFETCKDPVFRFLWRLCRDRTDAEDLLQDTFVAYWRKGDGHDGRGSVLAYLRRIAYHLYLNLRTKRARRTNLSAHIPPPAAEVPGAARSVAGRDARASLLEQVRRAVDDLPDTAREAFILHRFEGLDCREIAQLMGAPVKTVESRLRRATRALVERLAPLATDVGSDAS